MASDKIKAEAKPLEWYRDNVPCRSACPVKTDSGQYVQLIAQGEFEQAFKTARSPNPLASICGRVCAAPCEDACRRAAIDDPVSIRALKRFLTERYGSESKRPDTFAELIQLGNAIGTRSPGHIGSLRIKESNKQFNVAIIGSGPAGLGAAHDLALLGYSVTIFEAASETGGMMRYGIPEYRLPRSVIGKEISSIQSLGVDIKTGFEISSDYGLSELKRAGYDAVFLSIGAQAGAGLNVPGSDLDGVIKAVDYLLNINKGYKVNLGNSVLVIGGGSVALDAARTAIRGFYEPDEAIEATARAGDLHVAIDVARSAMREGSLNVHIASLESMAEMPAAKTTQGKEELDEAANEGIVFHPSRGPKKIIGDNGKVKGIELIQVASIFDEQGRFNPSFVEGSEEFHEFDSIILAIGQKIDTGFIKPEDNVELTSRGTIKVDPLTMATSAPGIYAGGDAAFGPRILIEAIANGKLAARSIDKYLNNNNSDIKTKIKITRIPDDEFEMPSGYEKENRCLPETIPTDRRTGVSEVEEVYEDSIAVEQAERCLQCHVETVYDADHCVLCNRCVDICPEECLELVAYDQVEIEGINMGRYDTEKAEGRQFSVMLKDHTRCIRCGLCALRCPTEAWTMQRFEFTDVIEGE